MRELRVETDKGSRADGRGGVFHNEATGKKQEVVGKWTPILKSHLNLSEERNLHLRRILSFRIFKHRH